MVKPRWHHLPYRTAGIGHRGRADPERHGEQLDHDEVFRRLTGELLAVVDAAGERRALAEEEVRVQ